MIRASMMVAIYMHLPVLVVMVGAGGCDRPTSSSAQPSATPAASATAAPPAAPSAANGAAPSASPATPATTAAGTDAGGAAALAARFDGETVGGPSSAFEAVVGDWRVAQAGGATGFEVDGSKWRDGIPSSNLADQAKRLYGDRYAEFLDGVKAFAFYPLAIYKEPPPAGDMRVSVRFYPIAGKIDQGAGIAFGITPSGSYHGVRANALEDNLLYFTVTKGKRNVIDTVRNVPTPTRAWHTLVLELRGKSLVVKVDDATRFEKTLDSVPVGRIGLWSKADSQVLFDDFEVTKP
jgi:hypothetical protein